jgi:hypothetical protein
VRDEFGAPRLPTEAAELERLVARVDQTLGAEEGERLRLAGRKASAESLRAEIGALLEGEG